MYNPEQRRLLSALCHGSIFFSSTIVSIGIPIAVLLVNDDEVIKENAREAISFHVNLYLYAILVAALAVTLIGIPIAILLGIALAIASFLLPIIAIVKIVDDANTPYRYPFIIRLL